MITNPTVHSRRLAPSQNYLQATRDLVFHHVHGGQLIYNACWEDPRVDRELLKLDGDSRVVMITSAGCNALDYLLDGPAEIHTVDMNYRQNALMELKLAVIRRNDFRLLFELFGIGSHTNFRTVYRKLRGDLPAFARRFWDERISYFDPSGLRRSFYYQGTAGTAAWLLGGVLFRRNFNIRSLALCLLDADSVSQQREIYEFLEPRIWGKFSNWMIQQWLVMTLLGVPRPQMQLIERNYPGGIAQYVKDKLRHVMAELPANENYFWRVYVTGSYTMRCCPNYLRKENLANLGALQGRVHSYTSSLANFLRENPGRYTHFVLLDHQDWLAWHDPEALCEEWELILANSKPGTKILMRSAGLDLSFVPERAHSRLRFYPELTHPLHATDRVGTYGSTHFAEVL